MPRAVTASTWIGLLLLAGCQASQSDWEPCGYLAAEPLKECSGMVLSRRSPGVFWVHNDSGDMPRLFAVDASGALLAEVRVQGADHVDWEDIAADDAGNLYIGDFGNNANERTDLVIYVIAEPEIDPKASAAVESVTVTRRIPFYFPEQRAFPDRNERNYDCEAMFWDAGSLYLLTKHRSDLRTVLYRVPLTGDERRAAQREGEFEVGSQVTAADLSPDGRRLVVLSYEYLLMFERPQQGHDFLSGQLHRVLIEGRQCEAVCFDGERLIFANEQREMYCLGVDELLQRERFLPAVPELDVPRLAGDVTAAVGGCRVPMVAAVEVGGAGQGTHAQGARKGPELHLGWSPQRLHVSAVWDDLDPPADDAYTLMHIMVGAPSDEPRLGPGQAVWEVSEMQDAVRVRRVRPEPRGAWLPDVEWRRVGSRLELHVRIPVAADPGAELAFNAVSYEPGARAEWCWSASSSTQPERNPVLWGRLRLRP